MDRWRRFLIGLHAMHRKVLGLDVALGGALGVVAEPLPHQIATVRKVLSDFQVRHLIADEVGLGKTIQALMIMNALRWQNPDLRTVVVAPDNLHDQWQGEIWTRGHIMSSIMDLEPGDFSSNLDDSELILIRPSDLFRQSRNDERQLFELDGLKYDLLIVDEMQSMQLRAVDNIVSASKNFGHVLLLTATPRLGDPDWNKRFMEILEPEAANMASGLGQSIGEFLEKREEEAIDSMNLERESGNDLIPIYESFSKNRRIIRSTRSDWPDIVPQRENIEITVPTLESEALRYDLAKKILNNGSRNENEYDQVATTARNIQRSARSAREVLPSLIEQDENYSALAQQVMLQAQENPGDSRLEALLDLLSESWSEEPKETFIIVCDDNPTILMLKGALARYFPDLKDKIEDLQRARTGEESGKENIRKMYMKIENLLKNECRILLLGGWVQKGLNLHHFSSNIIFYSLPWEIETIDQMIGRIDRIDKDLILKSKKEGRKVVKIWRILPDSSLDASISATYNQSRVFEKPVPVFSESEKSKLDNAVMNAAQGKVNNSKMVVKELFTDIADFETKSGLDQSQSDIKKIKSDFRKWEKTPIREFDDKTRRNPIQSSELHLKNWLELISSTGDFDIGWKRDKKDSGIKFRTMWYSKRVPLNEPTPFRLEEISTENRLSDHKPFITSRYMIEKLPLRTVNTDGGEENGRPLQFFDHGNSLHDELVNKYIKLVTEEFGKPSQEQVLVKVPEDHPALQFDVPILLSVAIIDALPNRVLNSELKHIFEDEIFQAIGKTNENEKKLAQKTAKSYYRSTQRFYRQLFPAHMDIEATIFTDGKMRQLSQRKINDCILAYVKKENRFLYVNGVKTDKVMQKLFGEIQAAQSKHVETFNRNLDTKMGKLHHKILQSLKTRNIAVNSHFDSVLNAMNRELERLRSIQSDSEVSMRMNRGRVEAQRRRIEMTQVTSNGIQNLLSKLESGEIGPCITDKISVIVKFVPMS